MFIGVSIEQIISGTVTIPTAGDRLGLVRLCPVVYDRPVVYRVGSGWVEY